MIDRWSVADEEALVGTYRERWGEDLARRTYSARLIGADPSLVLHGGGNTSVKTTARNILLEEVPVLHVKASGCDLATITPERQPALDLRYLQRLYSLPELGDTEMRNEIETHRLRSDALPASLEALLHAFLTKKFIDHTHADAILALTNRRDGARTVADALGDDVLILEYVRPGFDLAKAVADRFIADPRKRGVVLMQHGLVTWGDSARESYAATVEIVTRAEEYLAKRVAVPARPVGNPTPLDEARGRLPSVAPIVRGLLAAPTGDPDRPYRRVILSPLIDRGVLDLLGSEGGLDLLSTPPLTTDHLIRTKAVPLAILGPGYADLEAFRSQIREAVAAYAAEYESYLSRHRMPNGIAPYDSLPKVVLLPGLGALCAGRDAASAETARDIAAHTIDVKSRIASSGGIYEGLGEDHLFAMEYRAEQNAKLAARDADAPLSGCVAFVTGAAGAIGSGICRALLESGAHVAAGDIARGPLDSLTAELSPEFERRVIGVPVDVADPVSVRNALDGIARTWGGLDIVVANAGVAHVSRIEEMDLDAYRRLMRVNEEGTLLLLRESARLLRLQRTGGDIILVSTKNVFAPGAGFGAYSATKAAAHQLARIAALEFAEMDVRVNMVSPDAVFAAGSRKSGLWAEVGPARMRARGLDEAGLQEYYRGRNLLKARVTARHVANAVLFFATRQAPTTGATIPVDGGLPDATPR